MTGQYSSIDLSKQARSMVRVALAAAGAVSLVIGLLILVWPGKTAAVVTAIVAVYAIVVAIVYVCIGAFSKLLTGWSRIGHVVLGLVFLAAGIYALANLGTTTTVLAVFLGVFIGVAWLVEGIVALTTLSASNRSKGWTVFYAIVSIIAGVTLLFSPMYVAVLWIMMGAMLLVLGVIQIVRAIQVGKDIVAGEVIEGATL